MHKLLIAISMAFGVFTVSPEAFAEPYYFGKYLINKQTKLNIYRLGTIQYIVKDANIYKAGNIMPTYYIDRDRIKKHGDILWLPWRFDKKYIYDFYGVRRYKIVGNRLYGGFFLDEVYKIEKRR